MVLPLPEWALYPAGVAWALGGAGLSTPAMQAAFSSDIPRGSGLSSSASIEMAFGVAWSKLGGWSLAAHAVGPPGSKERKIVMWVSTAASWTSLPPPAGNRAGCCCWIAVRWNIAACRWPENVAIVVADTSVRRKLSSGGYNERRAACEEAVRLLSPDLPGIKALRDVSTLSFDRLRHKLPLMVEKRARHVVEEIERTRQAIPLLEQGQVGAFGQLMNACHRQLEGFI